MKFLLFTGLFFLGIMGHAQTYAPYTGNKANETKVSKPAKTKTEDIKPVPVEKSQKEEDKKTADDFQNMMNKAVEQLHQKDYQLAEGFYTRALNVSTEKTAWRALLSRATLYAIMKDDQKAIADLTKAIENKGTPQKQLAVIYMTRARLLANNNKMDLACKDVAKAKALGLTESLIADVDCSK